MDLLLILYWSELVMWPYPTARESGKCSFTLWSGEKWEGFSEALGFTTTSSTLSNILVLLSEKTSLCPICKYNNISVVTTKLKVQNLRVKVTTPSEFHPFRIKTSNTQCDTHSQCLQFSGNEGSTDVILNLYHWNLFSLHGQQVFKNWCQAPRCVLWGLKVLRKSS